MTDNRVRTISGAVAEIRKGDPGTAITAYAVRRLVVSGSIPSVRVGNRYLLRVDDIQNYFSGNAPARTTTAGYMQPPNLKAGSFHVR